MAPLKGEQRLTDNERDELDALEAAVLKSEPLPLSVLELWRSEALHVCPSSELHREVIVQLVGVIDEVKRLRALLERVRSYAVVDPLGNPERIALPHAARMFGIERDIDQALGPRLATTIAWLTRPARVCRACGHAARYNCGAADCPLERERR